ncbi:MAG: type II toxin-antitoxin system HicA family toxin [Ancalomicrobiaceae bacterium]|nr:type II toxin-antitoxin system HicA family toxin [Ancalomicrobiaceae bacterium]
MPNVEVDTRRIIARLEREGWISRGGGRHEVFVHPAMPGKRTIVPRHCIQSIGVARDIAKRAGWI